MSEDIRSEEILNIMAECSVSIKASAEVLFHDRVERDFTDIHDVLFDLMNDDTKQKVCIAAPRGFGKTTIGTIIYPAQKILFQDKKFIMPVSATASSAVEQAENLKAELISNVDIANFFGPMKAKYNWSKEAWTTANGVRVLPRGAGQQVRGKLFGKSRPDLIIVDDLETTEGTDSPEQRAKLKTWFYSDLCNCVDRSSKDWKILVIGTVLHEDSLIVELLEDPSWHSVRLELCDDNFTSNWPDFMTSEECKALYLEYKRKGQADVFFREYRNLPISTEDATFKASYFKDYDETSLDFKPSRMINVVIIDPAKTVQMHSAESAIVGIAVDRDSRRLYIRDVVSDKFRPDELYEAAFKMVADLKARVLAVEVTSLNEFITQPIKNEMMVRGIFPRFVELNARAHKADRIAALVPFYRLGYVYHNPNVCAKLESQLMAFPKSKLWDVMDATAYIVEVMEMEGDYFHPSDDNDVMEDEDYSELDDESPIEFRPYV